MKKKEVRFSLTLREAEILKDHLVLASSLMCNPVCYNVEGCDSVRKIVVMAILKAYSLRTPLVGKNQR